MNNKRNKRGPVRTQRNRSATADGVYSNSHFVFSAASQLGTIVQIQTRNEDVYEGILKTFSNNFEVVLELATLISKNDVINPNGKIGIPNEIFIFRPNDIVSLTIKDTDPQFATKDNHFQTDSAISARLNGAGNREEKELEPWEGELNGTDTPLELDSSANGWDPNDMFKKNEQEYGVTSTFDHSLRGYTVPLQHSDSADYKEAEAKANQIANEIEGNPSRKARLELENGDEEAAFAAVVRPSTESNGKYIPPAERKNQAKSGNMARTSPPPPPATVAPTTNSGNVAANGSASSSPSPNQSTAQVSPTGQYANNVPAQLQQPNLAQTQLAPPVTQSQIQPQMAVPQPTQLQPPAVQQAQAPVVQQQQPQSSHQPQRQNHGYGNRQGQKHMNGESGKMSRGPRSVYQSVPTHSQQPAQHALNAYQDVQPRMVEMNHNSHNNGRHHRDEVKDLQQFSQDFQLAAKDIVAPQQMPEQQVLPQCPQPSQHNLKVQSEVPPASSPPAEEEGAVGVDKLSTALKKSTLNPNAKEFVLNPTAKPFQPRSVTNNINRTEENGLQRHISSNFYRAPSASSQISRPQTPLTPSNPHYMSAPMNGQMPPQQPIVMGYMMSGGQPAFPQQPQGTRMRKVPGSQIRGGECMSHMSPMVAAATGQPLLTSHPPMVPYQTFNHAYQQMVRLQYPTQEVQYSQLAAPAGGQLNQYAPNQPAQVPPQQYTAPPPPQAGLPTQFVCANMPLQSHMMPQYMPPVPPHLGLTLMQNQHHPMHQGGPPA